MMQTFIQKINMNHDLTLTIFLFLRVDCFYSPKLKHHIKTPDRQFVAGYATKLMLSNSSWNDCL